MTFAVGSGIHVASADAPDTLPQSLRPGMPFRVGHRKGCPAFGARLHDYATTSCYGCDVPNVLLALWVALVEGGGLGMQGIFRLAPDPSVALAVERHLAKGIVPSGVPPEVLAHLIKSFLRRLPGSLLGAVPAARIDACRDGPGYTALRACLPPLEAGVLEWLVRMLCEVAREKEHNMMGLRNLTLVLAPNLLVQSPGTRKQPSLLAKAFRSGRVDKGGGGAKAAAAAPNPVEELMNIEMVSNALHTLAISCMRFSL